MAQVLCVILPSDFVRAFFGATFKSAGNWTTKDWEDCEKTLGVVFVPPGASDLLSGVLKDDVHGSQKWKGHETKVGGCSCTIAGKRSHSRMDESGTTRACV